MRRITPVLFLALVLAFQAALAQEDPPGLLLEWSIPDSQVMDVAADASGNVYVTDRQQHRLMKYDANGSYLGGWSTQCPRGVAVDSTGHVYVLNLCAHKVHKYTPSGALVTEWGAPNPFGLSVDEYDNVYIADAQGGKIRKFDGSGTLLLEWGTPGAGIGELCLARGVAVDGNGNVFTAEQNCNRTQKFDAVGNYITGWNVAGSQPSDVEVDLLGNVYVTTIYGNNVVKFDNSGGVLTSWSGLSLPSGLGLDPQGNIYIADTGNDSIKKYAAAAPAVLCVGFEPPMASGPVTVRGNRALPFKAQLFDGDNNLVTELGLTAPPVIQVWYEYGTPDADDVTDEALPSGQSSEGNQFFFDTDQRWHYNLKTKNYSAAGTYTVFMDSGDASEYVVDPMCIGQFVVN